MVCCSCYTFTPVVPFDAAEPFALATLADVAEETTQPEYVYLLRVAEKLKQIKPMAIIPTVLLPAAELYNDGDVDAVPAVLVHPEYVNLSCVFTTPTPH